MNNKEKIKYSNIGFAACFAAMFLSVLFVPANLQYLSVEYVKEIQKIPAIFRMFEISRIPERLAVLLITGACTSPIFLLSALLRIGYENFVRITNRKKTQLVVCVITLVMILSLLLSSKSYSMESHTRLSLYVRCISSSELCLSVIGPMTVLLYEYIFFSGIVILIMFIFFKFNVLNEKVRT